MGATARRKEGRGAPKARTRCLSVPWIALLVSPLEEAKLDTGAERLPAPRAGIGRHGCHSRCEAGGNTSRAHDTAAMIRAGGADQPTFLPRPHAVALTAYVSARSRGFKQSLGLYRN